jgi:hypothetical protein
MAILADGRIECNRCGWRGTEAELDLWPEVNEWRCQVCGADPHDPTYPRCFPGPNDDLVIWKCNRCGWEKVASCMWDARCDKCDSGSFTWLDLPEQLDLFQNGNCG